MTAVPSPSVSISGCTNPLVEAQVAEGATAYYAKDYAKATSVLLSVAHDPVARCFLGLVYLDDPAQEAMREAGWEMLTASAEAGFEYAWLVLAHRHLDPKTTHYSPEEASRWFLKGAELGCTTSQYWLAWCLCHLESFLAASKWLFVAVELGNIEAMSLSESVSVNMDAGEYARGRQLAKEWLDRKAQGPADHYHAPLHSYWLSRCH